MTTAAPNGYRPPAVLPDDLKALKGWLVWRLVQLPGEKKPRKMPHYINGALRKHHGTDEDRSQLATYDRAIATCARGGYSGIGLAILPDMGIVALDFDNVVSRGEVDARIAALVAGTYAELSPSGNGVRAFFKGSLPSRKDNEDDKGSKKAADPNWFGVEYFGTSGYVTVTGNVLPECEMFGYDTLVAPITQPVRDLFTERWGNAAMPSAADGDDDGAWLLSVSPKIGLSLAEARELVMRLNADCGYDEWWPVGAALHHEFDASDEALSIFRDWSNTGAKPAAEKTISGKWTSFGNYTGQVRTMAWVLKVAKEQRAVERFDAVAAWKQQIAEAPDEFALREVVAAKIARDTRLGELDREALAQVLLDAFKAKGTKYPIASMRKLIAPKRVPAADRPDEPLPEWAHAWVWVTDEDKFYRIDSSEWLSQTSFNAKYNREIADDDGHCEKSASWFALENLKLDHVTRAVYLPYAAPRFNLDGTECVNRYRPSSVPEAVAQLSDAGREAVRLVLQHLGIALGGRVELVQTIVSWIAHNVQYPGKKIRWAPLLKGVEGDGKSIIGKLIAGVMGQSNVSNVSPHVLADRFTGWAEGVCVVLLEEVRVVGQSRHDIFNALKPYVTNDSVPIHRKGKDEYNIINVTNQFGFTNHNDALPLNDNDRRWLIMFTPFATRDELEALVKAETGSESLAAYFGKLHTTLESQYAELRRWLLDYAIPSSFDPNGPAPHTAEKALMIAMSASGEEDAVRAVIEDGADGVGQKVLSSSCLTAALRMSAEVELDLKTTGVNRLLTRMGWTKVPKKVKWQGAAHNVWVRGRHSMEPGDLRDALEATGSKTDEGDELDDVFGSLGT